MNAPASLRSEAVVRDPVVLYHNPACGTSRRTLALIRREGIEPRLVDYLRAPPPLAELVRLAADVRGGARALLRPKEPLYAALGLDDAGRTDEALLAALATHPVLLARPVVRTPGGVAVCRPAETVLDWLPRAGDATVVRAARWPDDVERIRTLFREYADGLGVDLGFQRFDDELASLPGRYAAPGGAVLVAERDGVAVGCVGLRRLDETRSEIKRLYVRPDARASGLGRRLVVAICQAARDAGAERVCLDTLPDMQSAHRLYAGLGFAPIAAYTDALVGTSFHGLRL